jgi:hypothetical protein
LLNGHSLKALAKERNYDGIAGWGKLALKNACLRTKRGVENGIPIIGSSTSGSYQIFNKVEALLADIKPKGNKWNGTNIC